MSGTSGVVSEGAGKPATTLPLWAVNALIRSLSDSQFVNSRYRFIEPYVKSRTLRAHYAFFVWQLGAQQPLR
jgi:hypothetical protein